MKNCFYYVSVPETTGVILEIPIVFGLSKQQRNDLWGLERAKEIVEDMQSYFTKLREGEYVFTFGIAVPDDDEIGGWKRQRLQDITVKIEKYSSETVSAGKTIQIQ